jgi:hypothetical protein
MDAYWAGDRLWRGDQPGLGNPAVPPGVQDTRPAAMHIQTGPSAAAVFDEDRFRFRTGHGPGNTATLHNLAVNKLRDHGLTNIAAGLR